MGLPREDAAQPWSRYRLRHEWLDFLLAGLEQPVMEILHHAAVKARLAPALEVDPEPELLPQRTVLGLRLAPRSEKHDRRRSGKRVEQRAATRLADHSHRLANVHVRCGESALRSIAHLAVGANLPERREGELSSRVAYPGMPLGIAHVAPVERSPAVPVRRTGT